MLTSVGTLGVGRSDQRERAAPPVTSSPGDSSMPSRRWKSRSSLGKADITPSGLSPERTQNKSSARIRPN
jgi:hypothetical protein